MAIRAHDKKNAPSGRLLEQRRACVAVRGKVYAFHAEAPLRQVVRHAGGSGLILAMLHDGHELDVLDASQERLSRDPALTASTVSFQAITTVSPMVSFHASGTTSTGRPEWNKAASRALVQNGSSFNSILGKTLMSATFARVATVGATGPSMVTSSEFTLGNARAVLASHASASRFSSATCFVPTSISSSK
jgi:hypothetical protein